MTNTLSPTTAVDLWQKTANMQPELTNPGSQAKPTLTVSTSSELNDWLIAEQLSIGCTTYQTNRLFFVSGQVSGRLKLHERLFDKPMGLYGAGDRLYMTSRYQLWQFDNLLKETDQAGNSAQVGQRLYAPRTAHTTGDVNAHEVVIDNNGQIIFVNTDFSCLATLSPDYSFVPLWQPPFISKLVAEDRCHLNGVAMVEGKPRYVTACSATDEAAGWRNHRRDGGVVIDIETNEIIATGLSMPHSPRWYQGKLWLLNSGAGELGYIEAGRFVPVTVCPGFVRGLTFWGDVALVGLSKLRSQHFTGLALEERLAAEGNTAQCGLMAIDLKTGQILHWLHFAQTIEELFDVVILPGVQQIQALGLQGDELQRLVTFPGSGGVVTTKPTVKRPSVGQSAPVAGLPQQTQPIPQQAVKYQRVYHLTPSNTADYDALTFPSLQQRWQQQPPNGELLGISASINGSMVGFAVAERQSATSAEMISLLVLSPYRQQGIGTQLFRYLEQELIKQGCQQLQLAYPVSDLTMLALERLLQKHGWLLPRATDQNSGWRQAQKIVSSTDLST